MIPSGGGGDGGPALRKFDRLLIGSAVCVGESNELVSMGLGPFRLQTIETAPDIIDIDFGLLGCSHTREH